MEDMSIKNSMSPEEFARMNELIKQSHSNEEIKATGFTPGAPPPTDHGIDTSNLKEPIKSLAEKLISVLEESGKTPEEAVAALKGIAQNLSEQLQHIRDAKGEISKVKEQIEGLLDKIREFSNSPELRDANANFEAQQRMQSHDKPFGMK
ncbi:MAG: hypothetical protein K2X39_05955 [Silvanigrellaceae bacterium]|nr:hypothetical protein [Silvanigrellaceae bacterium]